MIEGLQWNLVISIGFMQYQIPRNLLSYWNSQQNSYGDNNETNPNIEIRNYEISLYGRIQNLKDENRNDHKTM